MNNERKIKRKERNKFWKQLIVYFKVKVTLRLSQSASSSWCQAPIWDPWPIFLSP
jgi:hypothetical protein